MGFMRASFLLNYCACVLFLPHFFFVLCFIIFRDLEAEVLGRWGGGGGGGGEEVNIKISDAELSKAESGVVKFQLARNRTQTSLDFVSDLNRKFHNKRDSQSIRTFN